MNWAKAQPGAWHRESAVRKARSKFFPVPRSLGEGGCSMKVSEDVRQYAAEQGIAEEEAIAKGMAEKSKEFVEKGAEVYTPA